MDDIDNSNYNDDNDDNDAVDDDDGWNHAIITMKNGKKFCFASNS